MHRDPTAVVRAVYEAFDRSDLETVMALFDPDATVYQSPALPWGGDHRGHAGLERFLTVLVTHLDSHPETQSLLDDGDGHVVQHGRTRGTVRSNGAPFDVAETHVWTVRDGRVHRFESYIDTAAMRQALDAAPAGAEPARV
ncbi:nuclear transport factor 2 family protein [Blastococcus deserti]|uniref:Nuclear transport factor 2 family protein n=1 Tax=Blastococcus deserti TaxID=2259033 RepID=A0ABW4XA50_9ACTN